MLQTTKKVNFDANKRTHLAIYKEFLQTGKWPEGGCPFKAEFPYLSVPATINGKIVKKFMKIETLAVAV